MTVRCMTRRGRRILTAFPVVTSLAVILTGCVTDDEYARQLCLNKGIAQDSAGYSDCLVTQKAWIEEDRRNAVRFRPND